jgi:Zn-dependent alcohol dehydrogenase
MAAAGLCHSDDHILKGDMSVSNEIAREYGLTPMFPMIGGHEGSGTVVEIGDNVTDFAAGDHVVMSFVAVCHRCIASIASEGRSATCPSASMIRMRHVTECLLKIAGCRVRRSSKCFENARRPMPLR